LGCAGLALSDKFIIVVFWWHKDIETLVYCRCHKQSMGNEMGFHLIKKSSKRIVLKVFEHNGYPDKGMWVYINKEMREWRKHIHWERRCLKEWTATRYVNAKVQNA